jgi:hypothetical protein
MTSTASQSTSSSSSSAAAGPPPIPPKPTPTEANCPGQPSRRLEIVQEEDGGQVERKYVPPSYNPAWGERYTPTDAQ